MIRYTLPDALRYGLAWAGALFVLFVALGLAL